MKGLRSGTKPKSKYYFDRKAADRACLFFEAELIHVKGEWDGQPFILAPWERKEIIRPLFGWKRRSDGLRRYRMVYVEVPKKNGKSSMCAGIALYLLFGDDEPGAEIYGAAADKDQASIVYKIAADMVERNDELETRATVYRGFKTISYGSSVYKVLSSEAHTKHGHNIHGVIFDELHAQPNRELWDTLIAGRGSRRQPVVIAITTAGWDKESICWEQHEYALKVKNGVIEDDTFLPVLYAASEDDDWTDSKIWKKANPGFGTTVKEEFLHDECKKAKEIPAYQNTFKRLYLNIWTAQESRWLSENAWEACFDDSISLESLEGMPCYGGLDMASHTDLSAFVLVFRHGEGMAILAWFWVPEEMVIERGKKDGVTYDAWVRDGWIRTTPGERTEYGMIRRDIEDLREKYDIREIAFDPWGMRQLSVDLDMSGFTMVETVQTMARLSGPTKELSRIIGNRTLKHTGNPVMRWMAANVQVKTDGEGNMRPDRKKSKEKIDGIAALVMAIDRVQRHAQSGESIYDMRGVLTLG